MPDRAPHSLAGRIETALAAAMRARAAGVPVVEVRIEASPPVVFRLAQPGEVQEKWEAVKW